MRVTIAAPYFTPERGSFEFYLARRLAALGHEVSVLTTDRHFERGSERHAPGFVHEDGFDLLRLGAPFSLHLAPVAYVPARALARLDPEAVIAVEYF